MLVPEEEVLERIVSWNQGLKDRDISLNARGPLPHITLAMIHMESYRLDELKTDVKDLTQQLRLSATGISKQSSYSGKSLLWLDIELSKELEILHKATMELRDKYYVLGTSAKAFDKKTASTSSIHYVEHFEKYGYQNYQPHITIGYGNEVLSLRPIAINARIAIGSLGDGCVFAREAG